MYKILVIVSVGNGNAQHVTTQVIEFDGMNAAIAAANAINKDYGGSANARAICLW
jgi:hypothetical protein